MFGLIVIAFIAHFLKLLSQLWMGYCPNLKPAVFPAAV